MNKTTLIEATRNGLTERIHTGNVAVVDAAGRIRYYAGNPHGVTFMRSAAKPLQALSVVETGTAENFDFTDRELAVACASHAGQPEHLEAVRGILEKAGLDEDLLECGSHPPGHRPSRESLYREGNEPTNVHSNCSGKHAAKLAVCRHMDWEIEGYREVEHPLQQMLLESIACISGVPKDDIALGVDGCGVVVHGFSVANMALAYARLATGDGLPPAKSEAADTVTRAMGAHPLMISGEGRVTTVLNDLPGGRFVAKGGAAGVYCMAAKQPGWGIAVKIADGTGKAASLATLEAARQMGWFDEQDCELLQEFLCPDIKNVPGDVVGELKPVFELKKTQLD